jgi:hypothetical protein
VRNPVGKRAPHALLEPTEFNRACKLNQLPFGAAAVKVLLFAVDKAHQAHLAKTIPTTNEERSSVPGEHVPIVVGSNTMVHGERG